MADAVATAPSVAESTGQAKCEVRISQDKPLVVEWPAAERAALEARATKGLIAVRYAGCEMEVLTSCSAKGQYEYVALTRKSEGVRITDADQLYAKLPVGAAGLEGKLQRSGQLNIDMTIVGRREASAMEFSERDLDGRCAEATHVIAGLTIGSYSLYAGKGAGVRAGATVGSVGAGVASRTDQEVLKTDGNVAACAAATTQDLAPPEGCGALLRLEVVPIDRVVAASPVEVDDTAPKTSRKRASSHQRKGQAATAVGFVGLGVGVIGAGVALGGLVTYTRNENALKEEANSSEIGSDRAQHVRRSKIGSTVAWTGLGVMALGTVGLVVGALAKANDQRRRRHSRLNFIGPAVGLRSSGFVLQGSF